MLPGVQVLSLADFPDVAEVPEDGETFEENARKKAEGYMRATGVAALADDSGLCVDALDGRPGVRSARYAAGSDSDRNRKLLLEMEGIPDDRRGARFRCALCLALPGGEVVVETGECEGLIARAPRGAMGFGYDPVFFIPRLGKTAAELTREEKAKVSHRGQAFRKMLPTFLARTGSGCRSFENT